MSRLPLPVVAVLAGFMSSSTESLAQGRGPSLEQIREEAQPIESILELGRRQWEQDWAKETKEREREEMRRDYAASASRLAEIDAFLRRLTGRFRIEGRIERTVLHSVNTGDPEVPPMVAIVPVSAKVAGVADCMAIGEGAGVNCLISASWPTFDRMAPPQACRRRRAFSRAPMSYCRILDPDYTAAQMLDTMRPAALVLGLDTDPPQLRGMLVTSDTLTNEWVGKLDGNKARLLQTQVCTTLRCYVEFGINAEPDAEAVTITLHQRLIWNVTITLTLYRDPEAQLEEALRPMRVR